MTKSPSRGSMTRVLVERHRQAPRHPTEELRAGGARIHDPARGEHAEQPGHADLSRVRIDRHLGELGAERIAGVRLPRVECLLRGRERAHALGRDLTPGDLFAQRPAGKDDGVAPGCGADRPEGADRPRQARVADLDGDLVDVDVQLVGGDLGEHRPGAGADVTGGDARRRRFRRR